MKAAVVLRRGTKKGKSFLGCTLRVIFRVTSDDLAMSVPVGVSFNPQLQGQVLHDERRGQTRAHMCAHTRTHCGTYHLARHSHPLCSQWRDGGHCPGLSAGRPAPGKGIAVFGTPELLLWVGFCMRRKAGVKGRAPAGQSLLSAQGVGQRGRLHNEQTKDPAMSPRSPCLLAPGGAPEPDLSPLGSSPAVAHLSRRAHAAPSYFTSQGTRRGPRPMAMISETAQISHFLSCGPLKFSWVCQTPGAHF